MRARKKPFSIFMAILAVLCIAFFVAVFLSLKYPPVHTLQPDTIPEGCLSSDQAYSIAIPYIREYVQENHRLISVIDVSFFNDYSDYFRRGPAWEVFAVFFINPQTQYVYGYSVYIWADTGQIIHKGAQGIM